MSEKIVIYQALVRLFGNTNTTNKQWGSKEENGVGKFNDFTDKALAGIKELGVTHVWYTGVLHHATTTDYTAIGVDNDNPAVVKGRAGSPYAVKDYYNVDPDLAEDPANRLEEFKALVARTHKAGLKVIIDIVPNHVARHYKSTSKPTGVKDFGEEDDTSVTYARDNNFYYNPDEAFRLPEGIWGSYEEYPAKWTGNDCRASQPSITDWYETVKLNYGIRPDGVEDFDPIPDTWQKMRDIALYWLAMGVDGFRFDMAEMVPVAFWHYLNSTIKAQYSEALLIAEVYNPQLYRAYLHEGKMDYLYDKIQLYDSLRAIVSEGASTDSIAPIQRDLADIAPAMLHFLENHDEQRIASPEFAGNPWKAV
ncbi:alpha-amylase family glycosyl hydrolase, partial [Capnocytophaga haemolytica]